MALADLLVKADTALMEHKANVAAVNQSAANFEAVIGEIKAETSRAPTLDDVRAVIDRMAADQAKT